MSQTRSAPVVCSCRSRGCNRGRYLDKDGNWQSGGSIVTSSTRDNHMLVDARMEAILDNDQDSLSDEDSMQIDPLDHEERFQASCRNSSERGSDINPSDESFSSPSPTNQDPAENLKTYDCRKFYDAPCLRIQPEVLHACLVAAILSIFEDQSVSTSSWFLKRSRDLLAMTASGLGAPTSKKLTHYQKTIVELIPKDIRTVIRWLQLDPVLIRVVCCPKCFAMYPYNKETPKQCIHMSFSSDIQDVNAAPDKEDQSDCSSDDPKNPQICGTNLFQSTLNGLHPAKLYAFQNLYEWIARLFSRPGVEDALEVAAAYSKTPYDPDFEASDIQHSRKWKQFSGPDQQQYTARSGNLTFGIFLDGINPYGNRQAGKHASITFIIMVCYSLPVSMRYKPQNLFLVGIAPGPKEPSLEQINWILCPIVEQLKFLWNSGLYLSQTCLHPRGRRVFAAILPFFADLPALRRGLGFAAPSATRMCSCCLLPKSSINNLDPQTWPRRTLADHKHWALQSQDAPDQKTRLKILKEQGVRYSVMLELPYWDIVDNHVVDAMHNLLLGLLKWHCQRFWCMSEIADEEEPKGIPTKELMSLLADVAAPISAPISNPPRADSPTRTETETSLGDSGIPFDYLEFPSNETSDDSFSPYLGDGDWGGTWTAPSSGKTIFDRDALAFINKFLPRIQIPTWIKRAIPVLGKASFGRLKADEWRNLFTIQLPLVLPIYWAAGGPSARSLFQNFAHLVSLVNLALKRTMSGEKIKRYHYHNLEYLKSSLILFPNVTLAPNHHMSVHIAESLEKFGPSRAWWSFSMERLMGKILKASHNNRLGQLEITFLKNFGHVGNLEAMISDPQKFPPAFRPLLPHFQDFNNPINTEAELTPKSRHEFLDLPTSRLLVTKINELFPPPGGLEWILASEYSKKNKRNIASFLSVNSTIENLTDYFDDGVTYSTFRKNSSNSLLKLKPYSKIQYGFIQKIFRHRRTLADQTCLTDMWLVVQPLSPGCFTTGNPFSKLDKFELQLELKIVSNKEICLIHTSEILSNCAWVKYRPSEICPSIKKECIGLVSLDR